MRGRRVNCLLNRDSRKIGMVAWKQRFPLQWQVANENCYEAVVLPGIAKRRPLMEVPDVV